MKELKEYIHESVYTQPYITKFYAVNIGINNNDDYNPLGIGDIIEVSYKYYSKYDNCFTFGKPHPVGSNNWKHFMDIKCSDIDSLQSFNRFIDKYNKSNDFFQLCKDYKDAQKIANKYTKLYKTKKWTLKSLLKEILSDKDLMSLGYKYNIKTFDTFFEKNIELIYITTHLGIKVEDNKIVMINSFGHSMGYTKYEVPNLQSLYKVITGKEGDMSVESVRQKYSIISYSNKNF